ncbi:hypothetical protein ACQP1G_40715 [Nocardia sp. CA-107356]|uniref:hypothetical protein n=1 Tax=Nocardia sp. CA-107356 TaxID=3239972 RepID=UPI003D90532D
MTSARIDRRMTNLEARVADIEEGYRESQLRLTRRVTGLEIWAGRVTAHANGVGHNVKLIAEHLGIRPVDTPEIGMPTEADIDAVLEEDC